MKKSKILFLLVFALAIGSAFASNIQKHHFNPTGWATSDCTKSAATNEAGCADQAGTNCTITVNFTNYSPVSNSSANCSLGTHILRHN